MTAGPRIALIHATTLSMGPTSAAFAAHWPDAEPMHILDNMLSNDRRDAGDLTAELSERIGRLADYGLDAGAKGVLYCCSAFGPAIDAVKEAHAVPVLRPNEAMFTAALQAGTRLVMLATFAASIASMEREFQRLLADTGSDAELSSVVVEGARDAINADDADTHDRLISEAAAAAGSCDAILLAHFSMDRARGQAAAAVQVPVLSAPETAVMRMRELLS